MTGVDDPRPHQPSVARTKLIPAMALGFVNRCPHCGEGRMFGRFLKVKPACEACGLNMEGHRADDLPPYLVIFIVGHIVGYLILTFEMGYDLPLWVSATLWPGLTLALALGLLQPVKGAVVGLQYACACMASRLSLPRGPRPRRPALDQAIPPASAASEARPPAKRTLRPRDAATLILIDRSKKKPRLLMGRRHAGLAFMGGKFVFPGGRVEPSDRRMLVAGALPQRSEDALDARLLRPSPMLGRSLALAAIRETYEETGLLVGTRDYGPPESSPAGAWQAFAEAGVLPDLEELHLVARAITPPGRPRRFDTRFFAADRRAVAVEHPGIVGPDAELTEIAWVGLDEARKLDLPRITRAILDDLEAASDLDFKPFRPIPFYFERYGKGLRELL